MLHWLVDATRLGDNLTDEFRLCATVSWCANPVSFSRGGNSGPRTLDRHCMTNYIPHYTKKKQILARKELALERLIAGDAAPDKLVSATEDVRDARVRVLRAQRATIVPKDDAYLQYEKIDARIQSILETPVTAILAEFGCAELNADGTGQP